VTTPVITTRGAQSSGGTPRCRSSLFDARPRVAGVVARASPGSVAIAGGPRVAKIVAHKRVGRIVACPW